MDATTDAPDQDPQQQSLISDFETLSLTTDPLINTAAAAADTDTTTLTSLDDLCYELTSLQDLACKGSWLSVLDKVSRARNLSLLSLPHEHLTYATFNILALSKLRRFSEAASELSSLDDLNSSIYHFETYPQHYPNRTGSFVPFSLRFLHADIPSKLGNRNETLDRLYLLLDFVRTKLDEKMNQKLVNSVNEWRRREIFVMNCLIGHHLSHKEFSVTLKLVTELIRRDSDDVIMLSKLGYIQMQLGDLDGSKRSFDLVEELIKAGKGGALWSEVQLRNLVSRNKALEYLVAKDYVSAVREYDECVERDGSDIVAINNKALSLMYLRDLADSVKVLESSLESVPTVALNETLVVNLCSMYELAYVNHPDIKRTLSKWIARVAPDDFDASCTRI
ncbi:hypothetical protein RJ641_010318 [Dillenia turbinata]|uniref:Trafficking protein particle complex subunit 12 n=1 Tax=Dillenia turbinata TaxID=194707 RepID=A0AAN8VAD4_9MAGN